MCVKRAPSGYILATSNDSALCLAVARDGIAQIKPHVLLLDIEGFHPVLPLTHHRHTGSDSYTVPEGSLDISKRPLVDVANSPAP